MPLFINCDNKELSIEQLFKKLLCDDGDGNPQLNIVAAPQAPFIPTVREPVITEETGAATTTPTGKTMVRIICTTGLEKIDNVQHPQGVYGFEPENGYDTVGEMDIDPNGGTIIIHSF